MSPRHESNASREIELKLEIEPAHIKALKTHPSLGKRREKARTQRSTYFDTPKDKLRKAGLTLRVREDGGRFIQTVKGEGRDSGAMFDRAEWEQEIAGPEPDLPALAATPAGALLRAESAALGPSFSATVQRTLWRLVDVDSEIEMILDDGEIVADGRRAPILEIELELRRGPPQALFALARQLGASMPLRLGVLSKNERGNLLRDGAFGKPVKAAPARTSADMTAGAAFQAIASACIRQFRMNEPLFVLGRDGGALHQVRVAFRRLRSAFSMFAAITSDDRRGHIREGLRWISVILGEARDLDVFVAKQLKPDDAPAKVRAAALAERDRAFDRAIAALDSDRFRSLMLDLVEWLATGDWLSADHPTAQRRDQPVKLFAQSMLDRFWRGVKKRGRNLAELGDEPRHDVRIAGKKLRYGSEFFAPLYAGAKVAKRRDAFVAALEDLQTHLGDLNDIVTARTLSERFAWAPTSDAEPDNAALLAASERAHSRLIEIGPFWR